MAMLLDDISYDVTDAVATITICRENKRNALARRHFQHLTDLLKKADGDIDVRAIVLTGIGDKAFCAGADLSEDEGFLEGLAQDATTGLGNYLRSAASVSKPIIGRVNGHCYAGGIGLLASCDFSIACDDVRFALPEVAHGIFPFVVLAALENRCGRRDALELALTGQPISAGRAHEIALISSVVSRDVLDDAVSALLKTLIQHQRDAIAFGLPLTRHVCIDHYRQKITKAEARIRELLQK